VRLVVRDRWLEFTEPLEGGVPYFYADIRGLITIAYGDLVDPLSAALGLPMLRLDGTYATRDEITAAWLTVKGDPSAATRGHLYARGLTTLRLSPQGMSDLAQAKLEANDAVLRARLTGWEDYPACAQMALHSLAWACGPGFHFPKLASACAVGDWDAASIHIQMNEWSPEGRHNAGLVPRNRANRTLMLNAARVRDYHLNPDILDWTNYLSTADAPTQPELPPLDDTPLPCLTTDIIGQESNATVPTIYPRMLMDDPDDDPPKAV
jgi:GH24 family phage-related lysozyme (muramidase)